LTGKYVSEVSFTVTCIIVRDKDVCVCVC